MGIIKELEKQRFFPVAEDKLEKLQESVNSAMQQYLTGEIDYDELGRRLKPTESQFDDWKFARLDHPGPLYGVMRRLEMNVTDAREYADHERAHFFAAREAGLFPFFSIGFSQNSDKQRYLNVLTQFEIPNAAIKETIEVLNAILTAPDEPSLHDLAKLPNKGVIYEASIDGKI